MLIQRIAMTRNATAFRCAAMIAATSRPAAIVEGRRSNRAQAPANASAVKRRTLWRRAPSPAEDGWADEGVRPHEVNANAAANVSPTKIARNTDAAYNPPISYS